MFTQEAVVGGSKVSHVTHTAPLENILPFVFKYTL